MNLQEKLNDIVSTYQGSCDTMSDEDREFLDTYDLWADFENCIFLCTQCCWYCEAHELTQSENNELICTECEDENENN